MTNSEPSSVAHNRTKLELKRIRIKVNNISEILIIVPSWNWNTVVWHMGHIVEASHNRTKLELKHRWSIYRSAAIERSGRSIGCAVIEKVRVRRDRPSRIRQDCDGKAGQSGAGAVKTPGGGFVLTRFLLPFHRMEKEEPVRLKDKNYKKRCCLCLKQSGSGKQDLIAKIRNAIGISIEWIFCLAGNDKFVLPFRRYWKIRQKHWLCGYRRNSGTRR